MSSAIDETREKATFFQKVHVWPLSNFLNYDGWFGNFTAQEDRDIAASILNFFLYYPSTLVDMLLRRTVGQTGHYFAQRFPDWKHSDFKTRCYYSFIPGEHPHPTDSGHLFVRKLRDVMGIPEDRILNYSELPELLFSKKNPIPVLLVDDFVGTGNQCVKAWTMNVHNHSGMTLEKMSQQGGHIFAYASLIANQLGYQQISKKCSSLYLSVAHILGPEYNLFDPRCMCWNGDHDLYKRGVEVILQKSLKVGIPDNQGVNTLDVRGFGKQGLALAFEHGAPDAIPGFFYFCDNSWIPLIKKKYNR